MATNAVGLFHAPSTALVAAGALKGAGFARPSLLSPIPLEGVEEVLGKKRSVIKNFTFVGAVFGGLSGLPWRPARPCSICILPEAGP